MAEQLRYTARLDHLILLPEQFAHARGVKTPERALYCTILAEALDILRLGPPSARSRIDTAYTPYAATRYLDAVRSYAETGAWFFDDTGSPAVSLAAVAGVLKLDISSLRKYIAVYRDEWEEFCRWWQRSLQKPRAVIYPLTTRRAQAGCEPYSAGSPAPIDPQE